MFKFIKVEKNKFSILIELFIFNYLEFLGKININSFYKILNYKYYKILNYKYYKILNKLN
jgi:hypothetical protein